MSPDALSPARAAARSLMSFIQELDNFDPHDSLCDGDEETKGFETDTVVDYLRGVRGFLASARARIIEAQLPTAKQQLVVISEPIQILNDRIFLLEREPKQSPDALQKLLTSEIKKLKQWRDRIVNLAKQLEAE